MPSDAEYREELESSKIRGKRTVPGRIGGALGSQNFNKPIGQVRYVRDSGMQLVCNFGRSLTTPSPLPVDFQIFVCFGLSYVRASKTESSEGNPTRRGDLPNRRQVDFQSSALPTELKLEPLSAIFGRAFACLRTKTAAGPVLESAIGKAFSPAVSVSPAILMLSRRPNGGFSVTFRSRKLSLVRSWNSRSGPGRLALS
jgi:hypothetical protein